MGIMDALKDWWVPLITIVNFIAVWVAWSFRKATVSPDDFKGFTTEIAGSIEKLENDLSGSIQKLENDLKGQKSAQDKILAEQDRRLVKVEACPDIKTLRIFMFASAEYPDRCQKLKAL